MTEGDVAVKFGDEQLVRMWIFFLLHNHCIEKTMNANGDYVYNLTQKGRDWIEMYGHSHNLQQ